MEGEIVVNGKVIEDGGIGGDDVLLVHLSCLGHVGHGKGLV